MTIEEKYPKDFQEFLAQFPDEKSCWQYLIDIRWPDGQRKTILQVDATGSNNITAVK